MEGYAELPKSPLPHIEKDKRYSCGDLPLGQMHPQTWQAYP
jgi:hypothetical protein